jgi:hypothetical protein
MSIGVAKLAPLDVDVGGTFDAPKPRLRGGQALEKPLKKLAEPAMGILKGLLKKK